MGISHYSSLRSYFFKPAAAILFITVLTSCKPSPTPQNESPVAENAFEITVENPNYKNTCRYCHGENGRGDGLAARLLPVKTPDWVNKKPGYFADETLLFNKMKEIKDESLEKKPSFKHFTSNLSDEKVKALAAFIKKHKGLPADKHVENKTFDTTCAFCHGYSGNGKGVVHGFVKKPHDFRTSQLQKLSLEGMIKKLQKSQQKILKLRTNIPHFPKNITDQSLREIAGYMIKHTDK